MTIKPFWKFQAKTDAPLTGELLLYGDISSTTWWGDEVTPMAFAQDLKNLGDISELNIYINSGGGDVFAGQAIYSMLKRHPAQKNVYIDGLAASIASVIAMAGDVVFMPKNAMLMIHKAWTMAIGNANDLRKLADDMDKIDESILTTYQAKTGLDPETITEMVNAETWLTADEAVKLGFADVIEDSKQISACIMNGQLMVNGQSIDVSRFRSTPQFMYIEDLTQASQELKKPPFEEESEVQLNQEPNNQAVESKIAEPLPIHLPELLNSGRTISSANEALIRQAMDCLAEVLGQLDNSDEEGEDDDMGVDGDGMNPTSEGDGDIGEDDDDDIGLFGVSLCQAQLNLTRRRLDYGF